MDKLLFAAEKSRPLVFKRKGEENRENRQTQNAALLKRVRYGAKERERARVNNNIHIVDLNITEKSFYELFTHVREEEWGGRTDNGAHNYVNIVL